MDVRRLIEEVRLRPVLWDAEHPKYRCHVTTGRKWSEIAKLFNITVDECRKKWKYLRDSYRARLNNAERRKEKSMALGIYDPDKDYVVPWMYLKEMSFLKDFVRIKKSLGTNDTNSEIDNSDNMMETENSLTDDGICSIEEADGIIDLDGSGNMDEFLAIKKEFEDPSDYLTEIKYSKEHTTIAAATTTADIENYLPNSCQEPKTTTTNNIVNCLSSLNLPAAIKVKIVPKTSNGNPPPPPAQILPLTDNNSNKSIQTLSNPQNSQEQQKRVSFLKNLEQEEEKLIKSSQEDMQLYSSSSASQVEDPDRNFLMSFLPHMKKLNDLQNLQFRTQMSQLMLNMLLPMQTTKSQAPPPLLMGNPHLAAQNNITNNR
ncbi:uncharacterized protein [Musca autumnalis]|uniref:uncharacterized protein n=1 Tax=Musca autumnalis TaxID=221902 RepID=UPI003CF9394D